MRPIAFDRSMTSTRSVVFASPSGGKRCPSHQARHGTELASDLAASSPIPNAPLAHFRTRDIFGAAKPLFPQGLRARPNSCAVNSFGARAASEHQVGHQRPACAVNGFAPNPCSTARQSRRANRFVRGFLRRGWRCIGNHCRNFSAQILALRPRESLASCAGGVSRCP